VLLVAAALPEGLALRLAEPAWAETAEPAPLESRWPVAEGPLRLEWPVEQVVQLPLAEWA
jgi:hypothetical protein